MTEHADLTLSARAGLPEALRALADELPRRDWPEHPQFRGLAQFWLERHMMFRQLLDRLGTDVAALEAGRMGMEAYSPRLSRLGGMLLNELHGHHQIEDAHYFPRLSQLDARLQRGFALLDADHQEMDGLLHDLAAGANALLQGQSAPGRLREQLDGFGRMLVRHLDDEEDLIVPVMLRTGFQG